MSGRTPEDALDSYLTRTRAVVACVTDRPVLAARSRAPGEHPWVYLAPEGRPALLRGRAHNRIVLFTFVQSYRVRVGNDALAGHRVEIVGYVCRLLDAEGAEIIAYHWHSEGISHVRDPHLHLSSQLEPIRLGRGDDTAPLGAMHIPTGFVPLADVVRLLIDEFGIEPRRDDWPTILAERRDLPLFPST